MQPNVGPIDRLFRFILGVGLVGATMSAYPVLGGGITQVVVAIIGIVLIGTSVLRFCPLYRVLGIRTCDCAPDANNAP